MDHFHLATKICKSERPIALSGKIDISIISSGANLADARLHRLTRSLLKAGLRVEIFAPGFQGDAPQASDSMQHLFIAKPLLGERWTRTNLLARYYRSRVFVLRSRGRVIYAISPEAIAPSYGYAKIFRKKLAVDLFENYLKLIQDRAWAKKFFGIIGWIAKSDTKSALWFAKRADLTTVADSQVPPFSAKNRVVVRNLPDLSLLTPSGHRSTKPRAIYIGDLRESRGLHTMLRAAELATDWDFDFIGGVAASDQHFVDQWLQKNNFGPGKIHSRVRFHGKMTPAQSWKFARGAWVGLSLLENTPAFVEAVPSKIYEYMSVGLATISSPLPRCVEIISQSKSGVIASTPEDVASALIRWQSDPAELDSLRAAGMKWASENLHSEQEYQFLAAEMAKLTR